MCWGCVQALIGPHQFTWSVTFILHCFNDYLLLKSKDLLSSVSSHHKYGKMGFSAYLLLILILIFILAAILFM